mgnify:CR=1 FL=1
MEIVRAEPGHEPQILALAQRSLGWGDDERFAALYRWKHDENPLGPSPRWVALEGDRVVGFRVFLRWRFTRPDGGVATAVRAVDTATDPDHQGKGIFRALTLGALDALRADGVDFVFNSPNEKSRPGYLKMGWIELGRPPVAVTPRLGSLVRIARSRTAADRWSVPTAVGSPAAAWFATEAGTSLVAAGAASQAADQRWRTDRTPQWLAWRYGLEALAYRVLTSADLGGSGSSTAAVDGAAVFRLRRRGSATEATVAEVLTPDPATRRSLVRGVLRATGADYALVAGAGSLGWPPSISLPAFSPLLTWRAVTAEAPATLDDFDFAVGDIALFLL